MFDAEDVEAEEIWPPERPPRRDTRVTAPLHGAYHAMMQRLEMATREHGLPAGEALVLVTVLREPRCPPWQIRYTLGLRRSTLSSMLARLEGDGFVRRDRSEFDGRRFEVELTPRGRIAADIADFVIREVEEEIAGYTSLAERQGARAVYEACIAIGRRTRGLGM
jgi:DNA-binding MarR family transcriptional regulator